MRRRLSPTQLVALASSLYAAYVESKPSNPTITAHEAGVRLSLGAGKDSPQVTLNSTKDTWEEQSQDLQAQFEKVVAAWEAEFSRQEDAVNLARRAMGLPSRQAILRQAPSLAALTSPVTYLAIIVQGVLTDAVPWPKRYRAAGRMTGWQIVPANHPLVAESYSRDVAHVEIEGSCLVLKPTLFRVSLEKDIYLHDTFTQLKERGLHFYSAGGHGERFDIYPSTKGYQDPAVLLQTLRDTHLFRTVEPVQTVIVPT